MLAISRALMLRPKLLLLDEPSFGLAPLIVAEIFRIMREINKQDQREHAAGRAERLLALDLAHDAYLLETGRVAMSGPCETIKNDETVRRVYLGY
jgi:branched-chain amino acid transport system ATP-binding protein